MAEIYSKSPVRAIGKVLIMEFSKDTNKKHIKVMKMAFVFKQTAVLVVLINNIGQQQTTFYQSFSHFSHFILYYIPQVA